MLAKNRAAGVTLALGLLGAVAWWSPAAATGNVTAEPATGPGAEMAPLLASTPPGPLAGVGPAMLSLYKTITYTATVLTTDQLWYMGVAAQAATTSGVFGVVNVVTSPMLTYVFEYTWEKCCEAPPGPDGVRPVDVKKAVIYRVLSTTRIFALALLFGNGMGSSVLTTAAIAATRTLVYMTNDFLWNHLTATGVVTAGMPPPGVARR